MKTIVLLLCMLFCSEVYGQAVWRGRSYSHPVCSNPNCRMCNSIRNQLYQPTYQPTQFTDSQPIYQPQPTYVQPQITYVQPTYSQPVFTPEQEPTPHELVPLVFDLLQPNPSDVFMDIGCGDGRILKEALKHKCKVLGIDLKPTPVPGALVITGDARDYDYTNVTLVYLYLYPDLMEEVIEKLPSCTKIVSYSHTTSQIQWKRFGEFYYGIKQ